VAFLDNPVAQKNLKLSERIPDAYVSFMEQARTFYRLLDGNAALLTLLGTLQFTQEEVTTALADIETLEAARAEYLREEGESQDATKAKDQALAALDKWMSKMLAVAKIALEDQPQLLETLSVLVRS
jgi:hypothetical protein